MKTKSTRCKHILTLFLTAALLLSLLSVSGFAAQETGYHDPAEHWIVSSNRTGELDINAAVTHETIYCAQCEMETVFTVWRTPEYTLDGQSALLRNVKYSDGTTLDGTGTGTIMDGIPGVDATYTGFHWTKVCCENCGTMNSSAGFNDYAYGKNVYWLYDCAPEFTQELDETVTFAYADSTYHTKTISGGTYCAFCYGTHHTENSTLERHTMTTTVTTDTANHRFIVKDRCALCGYEVIRYLTAKSVVASYFGTVDGLAHTITVSDLSDSGVTTAIRYGNSASDCTLTSAPSYTAEGEYTVYYAMTYSYGGERMTENGVAYVWLRDESTDNCTCGCEDADCDCTTCDGCSSIPASETHSHDFTFLETVAPTCTALGYDRYLCVGCGTVEKRNYVSALGHDYTDLTVNETDCEHDGRHMEICSRCGDVIIRTTPKTGHSFVISTVAGSCTSPGYKVKECYVCGERTITEITEADGHRYVAVVTQPTCTTMGYTTHTCAVCGDSYTDSYTGPTTHRYVAYITAPTCTERGYTTHVCVDCGDSHIEDHIDPTGHRYIAAVTAPTCTAEGYTTYTCTVCGDNYVSNHTEPSAHRYISTVTVPTCTEGGYTTHTCVDCGDSYTDSYTDPTGHHYLSSVTPATCTDGGYTTHTCSVCGDSFVDDYTNPLGHQWDDGTILREATCTEDGLIEYRCNVCDAARLEEYSEDDTVSSHVVLPGISLAAVSPARSLTLAASGGHSYVGSITAPTCTERGYTTYICIDYGDNYVTDLTAALGHDYRAVTTPPTCTTLGYTTYTCTHCGDSYRSDYVETLEHNYRPSITEPTCDKGGFVTYTCTVCGDSYVSDFIVATGHSYAVAVTAPTCTELGYTTYTCSRCGDSYIGNYTAASGHDWKTPVVISDSTCTGDGLLEYDCSRCDAHYYEAVPATGHNPGPSADCINPQTCLDCGAILAAATGHHYNAVVTAPTCDDFGYTAYTCVDCGDSYKSDYVRELGHSYTVAVIAPTCTEGGCTTYTCVHCGGSYVDDYTDPLGHDWIGPELLVSGTCNSDGLLEYNCSRCYAHYHEAVSATGHNPGPAADCLNPQTCLDCGAVLIPATGHHYNSVVIEQSCTKMGYTVYTCADCGDSYQSDYTDALGHDYRAVVTAPTCTKRGYTTYICTRCGDSYQDDFTEPTGHRLDAGKILTSAVCAHDGVVQHFCLDCGYMTLETIPATGHIPGAEANCNDPQVCTVCGLTLVPATGHDFQSEIMPPSCLDMGHTHYYCADCGIAYDSDYILPVGHSYVGVVTEPTCTAGGYTTFTCSACGDSYIDAYTEPTAHSYVGVVTAPTCIERGFTTYICTDCGDSYISDYTDALGHEWDAGMLIVNTTCNGAGVIEHRCVRCDYHYLETLSPDGHRPGAHADCINPQVCLDCGAVLAPVTGHHYEATAIAPTCTEMGYTTYTCADCGENYRSDYTLPFGHDYIPDVTMPTCTEGGYTTHICFRCGNSYVDSFTDSTGHHYIEVVTEPTCNERGYTTYICTDCGESYVSDYTDPLDHEWDEGTYIVNTTCNGAGVIEHHCVRCDYHYLEMLSPDGHRPGPEATCTTPQLCLDCGAVLAPATGHHYEATLITPTCSKMGYIIYDCADCDDSYRSDYTEPLGHDYGPNVIASTCTEGGYTTHICSLCGDSYVDSFTNPAGHNYVGVVTEPTCTERGYTTYTCTLCGDSYQDDFTEAIDHRLDAGKILTSAVCAHDGVIQHFCLDCGYMTLETIPATEHIPGAEATCTDPQVCTVCGLTLAPATGHDFQSEIVPPSCLEMGRTHYYCVNCGITYDSDYILPVGHSYVEVVTEPTCTAGGYTTYTCSVCGDSYIDAYTEPTRHSYVGVVAEPTCTERGYTTYNCTDCGESYVSDYTDPTGHEWDAGTYIVNTTCNGAGVIEHHCVRCDYHYLETLSPDGHRPGPEATCTTPQLCLDCGAVLAPATGHHYEATLITPTCTKMGYTIYNCVDCDDSYRSDYTEPLGHRAGDWIIDAEPATEVEGSRHRE